MQWLAAITVATSLIAVGAPAAEPAVRPSPVHDCGPDFLVGGPAPIRAVDISVSGLSCEQAAPPIAFWLRHMSRRSDTGPASVFGYRISPISRYSSRRHGRRPGRNFYFTVTDSREAYFVDLVRTIAVRRAITPRLRLLAVDLYTDGVIVRYAYRGFVDWTSPAASKPSFEIAVEDDLGTRYRAKGGGGSGDETVFRGEDRFSPAVPPAARRITVRIDRASVEVPL